MAKVYMGLGSNVGCREDNIRRALALMEEICVGNLRRLSMLVDTEPVGGPPGQPMFLNAAAEIDTDFAPEHLLSALKEIESRVGRVERQHWGPREIDLDILFYDDLVLHTPALEIPHPRICERLFVLSPLAEIAPDLVHPVTGKSVKFHLDQLLED